MASCSNIPSCLSALSGQKLCRLYQFLNNNGGYKIIPTAEDGDCLFGSFRRCTTLPAECADAHVRRVLVKVVSYSHSFFYQLFKRTISTIYGLNRMTPAEYQAKVDAKTLTDEEKWEYNLPGPFSFYGWLKYMLQNSSYGDSCIVMAMSMLWQLRITVLSTERLFEIWFRHNQRVSKVDMLLVLSTMTDHYVAAGKRPYFIRKRSETIRKRLS